jgi:hypothetical protein
MTETQAKKLKAGDKVYWGEDKTDVGTIDAVSQQGFYITWRTQNGWIAFTDCENVHLLEAK